MGNDIVFHYTNLYAFKSIIETGEIWLTRVDSLNDRSEYSYYKDIFYKARTALISEGDIKNDYDLSLINLWVDKYLIKLRDSYLKKTFVFSLSNNGDSIPMWNYYSDKLGIAIGFNKHLLADTLERKTKEYYTFSQCDIQYDQGVQIELIKSKLDEILKIANEPELMKRNINDTLDKVNAVLADMWYESYMYKENSFEYENESRMILCKLDAKKLNDEMDKVHSIVTGSSIKSIIKIKIAENWGDIITNITISPFNQSEIIVDNIHDFLERNKVNLDKDMIRKSKCPIRSI